MVCVSICLIAQVKVVASGISGLHICRKERHRVDRQAHFYL